MESHPNMMAYVKNHYLGLEVPYLYGSIPRKYIPDFIVQVGDGQDDPLNLIMEIKGYRGEDVKEKSDAMKPAGCSALTPWVNMDIGRSPSSPMSVISKAACTD